MTFLVGYTFLTWVCSVSATNSSESYLMSFTIWQVAELHAGGEAHLLDLADT
jgi:hypothetical protein